MKKDQFFIRIGFETKIEHQSHMLYKFVHSFVKNRKNILTFQFSIPDVNGGQFVMRSLLSIGETLTKVVG